MFRVVFQYLKSYPWHLLGFTLTYTLAIVIYTSSPFFYKLIVDAASLGDLDTIFYFGLLYVATRIFTPLLEEIPDQLHGLFSTYVKTDIVKDVLDKLRRAGFSYHTEKASGKLLSRMKRGDGALSTYLNTLLKDMPRVAIETTVALGAFLFFSWKAALALIVFIIVLIPIAYLGIRYNIRCRERTNLAEDDVSKLQVDNLIAFENVLFFGKENKEKKEFKHKVGHFINSDIKYLWSFRFLNFGIEAAILPFLLSVTWFSFVDLQAGTINAGTFLLLLTFAIQIIDKLWWLIYMAREYVKAHTDLKDYLSLLEVEPALSEGTKSLVDPTGAVTITDLSFSYGAKGKKALDHLNMSIAPRETIALVGKSGGGKTTLAKLLMRLYDPTTGNICFDGMDISDLSFASLRRAIGIVPQEPILFNNTIAYNISYPKDNCTEAEMKEAASKAQLTEFIDQLPQGYNTVVGERGIKLSGGQKQRLAIARAFIHDPKIIIFDEATSQLDSENEQYIQDALDVLKKDKTTIIIAHRLSTIMHADRIVVMKDGGIEEIGSHDELLKKNSGLYKRLWNMQVGGVIE